MYLKEHMIIINNETSFYNTFKAIEDIEFNKKMIVIHAFITASNSEYELENIELNEKIEIYKPSLIDSLDKL